MITAAVVGLIGAAVATRAAARRREVAPALIPVRSDEGRQAQRQARR